MTLKNSSIGKKIDDPDQNSSNKMEWTSVRNEQDLAYKESLLQDILKKTVSPEPEPVDKKLTLAELREKRIQAFTQTSVKKT